MKKTSILLIFIFAIINFTFAVLPTPTNYSPSNNSTSISASVSINWYSSTGATYYELKIANNPAFSNAAIYNSSQTNYTVGNLYFSTTYYWQIRAKNASDSSLWSNVWNFTTTASNSLYSPSNNSTNLNVSTTLNWYSITGANTYQLDVDTSASFNSPKFARYLTTSSYTDYNVGNLLFNTKYYWRVRSAHAADTSAWSAVWNFTTTSSNSLYSPSNNSTNLNVSITLDWYSITGANTYQLDVDTSAGFNSPKFARYVTTSSYTDYNVGNLLFNTKYYWRVRSAHAADTSAWSAVWNFTTTAANTLYSPSNNSTNLNVSTTLDWYSITGANTYQLDVDTSASFNSPKFARYITTSSYTDYNVGNLLFNTKYYWRVRSAHAADTSAWSVVWNFTTTASNSLYSPSNNSTNLNVSTTLDWYSITGAITYQLDVDTSAGFNSPKFARYVTTSSYTDYNVGNLLFNTKYYWRVRSAHVADTSAWSAVWNFTTVNTVTLYSPTNNSVNNSNTDIVIDWYSISGSSNYDFMCDTSQQFNSPLLRSGSTTSSYTDYSLNDLAFGKTWYWKVRARHQADTSVWSGNWNFSINNAPILFNPANNATGVSLNPVIYWNSFAGITNYRYQYDVNPLFTNPVSGFVTYGTTQKTLNNLSYGTTYFWRMQAMHTTDTSAWSNTWNFTTLYQITNGPVLISPASASQNVAIPVDLQWSSISGALVYEYQLDINSNFTNPIIGNTTQLTVSVPSLMGGTIYYWRVRANNGSGYSPWSAVWVFTSQISIDVPQLQSPTNNSTAQPLNLTLNWNDVSNATSYEYQYSTSSSFATYNTANTTQSQAQISGLSPNTTYYWRVKANNGSNYSAWSNVWSFTTIELLNTPQLLSPQNMTINLPLSVSLDWDDVANATSFEFQYSTTNNFTLNISGNTTQSQAQISGLSPNTTYYWRVKATNGTDYSAWSNIWSFTTMQVLQTPQLTSPVNMSVNTPLNITLNWENVLNATSYEYQYSLNAGFNPSINGTVNISQTDINNLNSNTEYYWRVRAVNGTTFSDWSNTWTFTTMLILNPPVLNYPANNAINIPVNVMLNWDNATNALNYEYQYSTDASFNNSPVYTASVSEAQLSNLNYNTTYYWRVRSLANSTISVWSSVNNFITINDVGIQDKESETAIIYPNPANDILNIRFTANDNDVESVEIYNATGKLQYQSVAINKQIQINVSDFSKGIYLLKVIYNNKTVSYRFVVE